MRLTLLTLTASSGLLFWPVSGAMQEPTGTTRLTHPVHRNVELVMQTADDYFRRGLENFKQNNIDAGRRDFDLAIDTILESGFDVRANDRLNAFYLTLVERISKEEALVTPQVKKEGTVVRPVTLPTDMLARFEARKLGICESEVFERSNIKGIRLRMNISEVRLLLPQLTIKTPTSVGDSEVTLSPPFKSASMKDLFLLKLSFLDAKVYRIIATYNNGHTWDSSNQFVEKVAEIFGLPTYWQRISTSTSHPDYDQYFLQCKDSYVSAGMFVNRSTGRRYPMLMLVDTSADNERVNRSERQRQQALREMERQRDYERRSFRP